MKKTLLLLIGLISAINIAQAKEPPFYIGFDFGDFAYEESGTGADTYSNADGISLRLGYDLNNYLAIEGQIVSTDDFESSTASTLSLDYTASLFARANLRFQRVTIFARGGITRLKSGNTSDEDFGYGVGIDFYGTKNTALTLMSTNYYIAKNNGLETDYNAMTFGVTYYFGIPRLSKRY